MRLFKNIPKAHIFVLAIAIPVLIFHAFYGNAGFDWDKAVKKIENKLFSKK